MPDEFDDFEAKYGAADAADDFDAFEAKYGTRAPEPIVPPSAPGAFNVPMEAYYAGLPKRGGVAVLPQGEADPVAERGRVVMEQQRVEAERAAARREVIQQFQQDWVESGRSADEYLAKYDPDNRPEDFDLMLQHAEAKATAAETEFQQRKGELAFRDVAGAALKGMTGFDAAAAATSPELMARSREDASGVRSAATMLLGVGGAVLPISRLRSALAVLGRTGSLSGAMAVHSGATTAVGTGDAGEAGLAALRGGIQGAVAGAAPVPMPRTGSAAVNLAGAATGEGLSNVAGYGMSEALTGGEVTGRGALEQFVLGAVLSGTARAGEAARNARTARVGMAREAVRERRVDEAVAESMRVADEVRTEGMARQEAEARSVEAARLDRPLPPIMDAEGREVRMGREPRGGYSTEALTPTEPIPAYDPLLAPGGEGAPTRRGGMGGGGRGRMAPPTDPLLPPTAGDAAAGVMFGAADATVPVMAPEPPSGPRTPPNAPVASQAISEPEAVSGRPVASEAPKPSKKRGMGRKAAPVAPEPTPAPAAPETPLPAEPGAAAAPARGMARGAGARKTTKAGAERTEAARDLLRKAVNNPDLVGAQRADTIEGLRNLVNFYETYGAKSLDTGVEFGDKVAYTGEDAPPGMRAFIFLEGAKAGRSGVAKTPEASAASAAQDRADWQEQQAQFRRLREPEAAEPPARGMGGPGARYAGEALPPGALERQAGESVPAWQARVRALKEARNRRMGGLEGDPEAGFVGLGRGRAAADDTPASPGWWSRLYGQLSVPAQRLFGQTFKAVEGQGGGVGDAVVADGQRSLTEAAIYRSEVADAATEAKRASSGGFGVQSATKANAGAQTVAVEGQHAGISRFRELIERDAQPRNAAEARMKDAWQRLLASTWDAQARRGLTHKNKAGVEEPMRPITGGKGKTLPYMGNERLSEILDTGETHPDFAPLLDAVAELNPGKSRDSLKAHLLERHEATQTGMTGAEGHMASEFSRSVIMPDFIRVGGQMVPVMEVNPFRAVDILVNRGSHVVGADMAFGRLSKSRVKKLRDDFLKGGGRVEDFNAAMRSLYGMSPTPHRVRFAAVDTPLGDVKAGYNVLANLSRSLTQTGSAAWNAAEFIFGNATLFNGFVNQTLGTVDAVVDGISRLAGRGHTSRIRELIDLGLKTENVADKSMDIHISRVADALNRTSRMLSETTSKPIEEGQESAAGSAALRKMRGVMKGIGDFSTYRRERLAGQLQVYADLTKQEAVDFLEGSLPQAQQDAMLRRIMERVVPSTTASNLAPAQRSRFEHSPWTKMAVKFYRWASNNLRTSAKTLDVGVRGVAGKGRSLAERGANAAMLTEFAAMKAIQGGAANLLVAMLLGKEGAADKELERLMEDPAEYFALAAFSNAVAGPVGALAQGTFRGSISPRLALPVQVAQDFILPPLKAAKNLVTGEPEAALMELGVAAERAIPPLRGFTGGAMGERKRELAEDEPRGMGRRR